MLVKPQMWWPGINWQHPLARGLVGCWPFWEGAGSQVGDISGKGNHGILNNGTNWIGSPYGWVTNFDEIDDYILIPDFTYGPDFSISFWFKVRDLAGAAFQYMFSHGVVNTQSSVNIFFFEESVGLFPLLRTSLRDSNDPANPSPHDLDVSINYEDGEWHCYTLTVGSSFGSRVYVDGIEMATASDGGDAFNPSTGIYVGGREDLNVDRFFGGSISYVYLHNRSLIITEIQQFCVDPFVLHRIPSITRRSVTEVTLIQPDLIRPPREKLISLGF